MGKAAALAWLPFLLRDEDGHAPVYILPRRVPCKEPTPHVCSSEAPQNKPVRGSRGRVLTPE